MLDELFGSTIHWAGEHRKGEDVPAIERQLADAGKRPYVVPYGGSNALGASAYVDAMRELAAQRTGAQKYSHTIFASSSGGTHAGLALGNSLFHQTEHLIGINIDKADSPDDLANRICDLSNKTAELLNIDRHLSAHHIVLNSDYCSAGYGAMGVQEKEAIALMARREGVLLDPVYSGRAFAALIGMIKNGEISKGQQVLFWHTGGAPALFDYAAQF